MRVPATLVFLGFAYELLWRDMHNREKISLFKLQTSLEVRAKHVYGLFSNGPGTAIYSLPLRALALQETRRRSPLFRRWADYDTDIEFRFNLPDSQARLERAGKLDKVEYTSDKLERPGDQKGRFRLYTHKFRTPLDLYTDRANNPRVFGAQLGTKRLVTSRGLVG